MPDASSLHRFVTRAGASLDFTVLGFGTAPLGNFLRRLEEKDCDDAVEAAWAAGMRHFDTAPLHGLGLSAGRLGRPSTRANSNVTYSLVGSPARIVRACSSAGLSEARR